MSTNIIYINNFSEYDISNHEMNREFIRRRTENYLKNLYNLNSINEKNKIIDVNNNNYQINNVYVNTQPLSSN